MASTTRGLALGLLVLLACDSEPTPGGPPPAVVDAGAPVQAKAVPDAGAPEPVMRVASIVINLSGTAEVQRAGSQDWVALKIGDPIRLGDAVRTSADSEISIGFGAAKIHLQDESSVRLKFLDPHLIRAEVQGEVEAASQGGKDSVQLEGPGGAVATVSFGRAVMHTQGGSGAVAALDGKVSVSSAGGQVELAEGGLSVLHAGKAPTEGSKAPKRAVLAVDWPPKDLTNKPVLKLHGRSGPWNRVFVQGHHVELGEDGGFEAEVPLRRGRQQVRVVAVDVLGHRKRQSKWITLDPDAPNIQAEVRFQ